jgi:acetyl esterase/lipase
MTKAVLSAVLPIWPGAAPGSEDWTHHEQASHLPPHELPIVRNIVQPTLTVYLPEPAVATGTAAIVCPGGAFHFLAIEHEGTQVVEWLVTRGVAAFILRYRVLPTAVADDVFGDQMRATMADRPRFRQLVAPIRRMGAADGRQALALVRQRAADWRIDPQRIGLMGFSAGGYVTTAVALQHDPVSRPNFVAPIYTAPWDETALDVPSDAAPMFLALASDDDMAVGASLPLYQAWREAGHPVELHIFGAGGHGFGMRHQGIPADAWVERFGDWLGHLGLLRPAG